MRRSDGPLSQQQVACTFEHLALVDGLFHVVWYPTYVIQLLIHVFDHMEMVKDMYRMGRINQSCVLTEPFFQVVPGHIHCRKYLIDSHGLCVWTKQR